jgi:hypothetical protein
MTDEPTPVDHMVIPGDITGLTPEQRAALEQLAERIVTHVRVMIDAFDQFAAACVEAQRSMEELRRDWDTKATRAFELVDDTTPNGDTTP